MLLLNINGYGRICRILPLGGSSVDASSKMVPVSKGWSPFIYVRYAFHNVYDDDSKVGLLNPLSNNSCYFYEVVNFFQIFLQKTARFRVIHWYTVEFEISSKNSKTYFKYSCH